MSDNMSYYELFIQKYPLYDPHITNIFLNIPKNFRFPDFFLKFAPKRSHPGTKKNSFAQKIYKISPTELYEYILLLWLLCIIVTYHATKLMAHAGTLRNNMRFITISEVAIYISLVTSSNYQSAFKFTSLYHAHHIIISSLWFMSHVTCEPQDKQ